MSGSDADVMRGPPYGSGEEVGGDESRSSHGEWECKRTVTNGFNTSKVLWPSDITQIIPTSLIIPSHILQHALSIRRL
jgi:hypothetical protein